MVRPQVNFGTLLRPIIGDILWWPNLINPHLIQYSLAIIGFPSLSGHGIEALVPRVAPNPNPINARPLIWGDVPFNGQQWRIATLHAPSIWNPAYQGLNAAATTRAIAAWDADQLQALAQNVGNAQWMCAGDFNAAPGDFPPLANIYIALGPDPTHQVGLQIDFIASDAGNAANLQWQGYATFTGLPAAADHFPQLFVLA